MHCSVVSVAHQSLATDRLIHKLEQVQGLDNNVLFAMWPVVRFRWLGKSMVIIKTALVNAVTNQYIKSTVFIMPYIRQTSCGQIELAH